MSANMRPPVTSNALKAVAFHRLVPGSRDREWVPNFSPPNSDVIVV